MTHETIAPVVEKAIRDYIALDRYNKLNADLKRTSKTDDKLTFETTDFIGRVSLRELGDELKSFGFEANYQTKDNYSSLDVELSEPSLSKGMATLTARTKELATPKNKVTETGAAVILQENGAYNFRANR